jgi:5-formyltetrahydrofolate cyclo-ligase
MGNENWEAKQLLREQIRARLKTISTAALSAASSNAQTLLETQALWETSSTLLFYAPLAGELDIWPSASRALAQGKQVALPRFVPETNRYIACTLSDLTRDLAPGRYGIREPVAACQQVALNRLDFVLVPGVAFDLHGRRLGRGKGFYDQLLAEVRGKMCGVALDEQIVPFIPVEPHDVTLDCILTPTRWIEP